MSQVQETAVPETNGRLHPLIEQIYRDADDRLKRSAISVEEGQFLAGIITARNVVRTLEIGCANGLSSLFICDALRDKQNPHHVIVDPFQTTHWKGKGIANLRAAGFDFWELIEKTSDEALPWLLTRGDHFDLVFIDGCHTFDNVLVDFFYAHRLLNVGGVVVFDDVSLNAVKHVVRYVFNYPNLAPIGSVPYGAWRRKLLNVAKQVAGVALWPFTRVFGKTGYEFLSDGLIKPRRVNPLDSASMIAFLKTAQDERSCEWYEPF
jgi:predicted O-methyltransferase YrrM